MEVKSPPTAQKAPLLSDHVAWRSSNGGTANSSIQAPSTRRCLRPPKPTIATLPEGPHATPLTRLERVTSTGLNACPSERRTTVPPTAYTSSALHPATVNSLLIVSSPL